MCKQMAQYDNQRINHRYSEHFAGKIPDLVAFGITLLMTCVLALGASKSVLFNNALNAINLATWVFIMTAGLFYIDTDVWHEHDGFLPFGWSGVSGTRPTNKYLLKLSMTNTNRFVKSYNPKRFPFLFVVIYPLIFVFALFFFTFIVPFLMPLLLNFFGYFFRFFVRQNNE